MIWIPLACIRDWDESLNAALRSCGSVSEIGYGGWYPGQLNGASEDVFVTALRHALALGVTLSDTASNYRLNRQ
jgi:aryl-alcohol dehydrogenase-like predicted oxidoreductase